MSIILPYFASLIRTSIIVNYNLVTNKDYPLGMFGLLVEFFPPLVQFTLDNLN